MVKRMHEFVDCHHHLVYGIDDGPASRIMMSGMLQYAHTDGVRAIIATPHAIPGARPFKMDVYRTRLEEARALCAENGLDIALYTGCEIMYTDKALPMLLSGEIPTLAESDSVLIEFLPNVSYDAVVEAVLELSDEGFRPILAHVERYGCLMLHPKRAVALHEQHGARYQVNCQTVIDGAGFLRGRTIDRLLKEQMIDYIATDAHNVKTRPCRMGAAYHALIKRVDKAYADRLTGGNARMILP